MESERDLFRMAGGEQRTHHFRTWALNTHIHTITSTHARSFLYAWAFISNWLNNLYLIFFILYDHFFKQIKLISNITKQKTNNKKISNKIKFSIKKILSMEFFFLYIFLYFHSKCQLPRNWADLCIYKFKLGK